MLGNRLCGWPADTPTACRYRSNPELLFSAGADNGTVIDVEPGAFEDMVVAGLDSLPEDLGRMMRNVAVTVEHGPGRPGAGFPA